MNGSANDILEREWDLIISLASYGYIADESKALKRNQLWCSPGPSRIFGAEISMYSRYTPFMYARNLPGGRPTFGDKIIIVGSLLLNISAWFRICSVIITLSSCVAFRIDHYSSLSQIHLKSSKWPSLRHLKAFDLDVSVVVVEGGCYVIRTICGQILEQAFVDPCLKITGTHFYENLHSFFAFMGMDNAIWSLSSVHPHVCHLQSSSRIELYLEDDSLKRPSTLILPQNTPSRSSQALWQATMQ